MDYSLPGSSVHRILKARIQEWAAVSSSGDLPDPGIEPASSVLAGWWGFLLLLFLPLSHQRSPRLAYPVTKTILGT